MGTEEKEVRGESLSERRKPPRATQVRWRASLAVASLLGGCWCLPDCRSHGTRDASADEETVNYTMPIPVPLTVPQIWELAGSEAIGKAGASSANEISEVPLERYEKQLRKAGIVYYLGFAGYVGFHELGQTKDAEGYEVITFKDQSVVTGKYSMRLTLGQDTTGGPPGFATERFVTVKDLKLVERTVRSKPVYTDGKREVLPGELFVRRISAEDWHINDRYALAIDPSMETEVWISIYPHQCFSVFVTESAGRTVSLVRFDESHSHFRTTAGERYYIGLSGRLSNDCHPDRYCLTATIEEYRGGYVSYSSDPGPFTINWFSPAHSDLE
jgi:hypothetical protein